MNKSQEIETKSDDELVLGVESVSAVFAHDIATPLTTARMNAELLTEYFSYLKLGLESDEAQKIPDHIRLALKRAPELIKSNIETIQHSLVDYKQYLNALQHESGKINPQNSRHRSKERCLNILLVDDEEIHHDIAGAVLGAQHTLAHASSGENALKKCETKIFDVILMDMKMPGLSGEQTVEKMRSFVSAETIILGLTNLPMGKSHDSCSQGGFDGFMEKPLRSEIFETLVESVTAKNH